MNSSSKKLSAVDLRSGLSPTLTGIREIRNEDIITTKTGFRIENLFPFSFLMKMKTIKISEIISKIISPARLRVKSKNETFIMVAARRRFFFLLSTYSFAIKKKGIAERRYSAAKPLWPRTEPGGITVGSGKISIRKTSQTPTILKRVEIIITE